MLRRGGWAAGIHSSERLNQPGALALAVGTSMGRLLPPGWRLTTRVLGGAVGRAASAAPAFLPPKSPGPWRCCRQGQGAPPAAAAWAWSSCRPAAVVVSGTRHRLLPPSPRAPGPRSLPGSPVAPVAHPAGPPRPEGQRMQNVFRLHHFCPCNAIKGRCLLAMAGMQFCRRMSSPHSRARTA